jgi:hypothetical protein
MSVRETYLNDYGISSHDAEKILSYCRSATRYDQQLILQAAQEVYPEIAPYLFLNLTTGIGYDRMGNIPMQRKDFQGYRRKTIETYDRYMVCNGKPLTYSLKYDAEKLKKFREEQIRKLEAEIQKLKEMNFE